MPYGAALTYAPLICTGLYSTVISCTVLYHNFLHILTFFNRDYIIGVLRKTEIFRCHVYGSQGGRLDFKEEASFREKEKAIVQALEIGSSLTYLCNWLISFSLAFNAYDDQLALSFKSMSSGVFLS